MEAPTDSSTDTVPPLKFVLQEVHYKFTSNPGGDTSFWDDRQIRFVTPQVSAEQAGGAPVSGRIQVFNDAITGLGIY